MPYVWFGFVLNAVSGVVLFMADATKDYYSNSFRWKMLSIVVGLAVAVALNAHGPARGHRDTPPLAKVLATLSLLCWVGAIVSGRLIAYLSPPI